jgi:L-asparaginase
MKISSYKTPLAALTLSALLAFDSTAWALPKIKVLATGGTIAGAQDHASRRRLQVRHVLRGRPDQGCAETQDIAEMSGEQVANIGSQTMNHEVWLKLAALATRC